MAQISSLIELIPPLLRIACVYKEYIVASMAIARLGLLMTRAGPTDIAVRPGWRRSLFASLKVLSGRLAHQQQHYAGSERRYDHNRNVVEKGDRSKPAQSLRR